MRRSSSLLIHTSPLQILPPLAIAVGVPEAMVLQQIHYLAGHPQSGGWVALTAVEWVDEHVPFYSRATVERVFKGLRERGLLIADDLPRGRDGGKRSRVRIDYDAMDVLEQQIDETEATRQAEIAARRYRQFEGRPALNLRAGVPSNRGLAHPQIEGTSCKKEKQRKEERAPSLPDLSIIDTTRTDQVGEVHAIWLQETGRRHDDALTAPRAAVINQALDAHDLAFCVDAVKGWRLSAWHNGDKDGVTRNILAALLHPEQIEQLADLQRRHAAGNVAGRPGVATVADIQAAQRMRDAAA